MNDAASDDSDSGGESPAEGIIDKGPMSPESDSTDNESRSPWECDGTTRKWKDLKRVYKAEGKDWLTPTKDQRLLVNRNISRIWIGPCARLHFGPFATAPTLAFLLGSGLAFVQGSGLVSSFCAGLL